MPQTTSITVENIKDTATILRVRFFNATATITSGAFIVCDASGGAFTITLPPAVNLPGQTLIIIKADATANVVTIDGNGSDTINGVPTQANAATTMLGVSLLGASQLGSGTSSDNPSLNAQYDSLTIRSTGLEWLITAST